MTSENIYSFNREGIIVEIKKETGIHNLHSVIITVPKEMADKITADVKYDDVTDLFRSLHLQVIVYTQYDGDVAKLCFKEREFKVAEEYANKIVSQILDYLKSLNSLDTKVEVKKEESNIYDVENSIHDRLTKVEKCLKKDLKSRVKELGKELCKTSDPLKYSRFFIESLQDYINQNRNKNK